MQTMAMPSIATGRGACRPANEFLGQAERALGLLRGQHALRLSLFRCVMSQPVQDAVVAALDAGLRAHGLVGRLADGAVAILYVGPRGTATTADQAVERQIVERIRQELACLPGAGSLRDVEVAHRWADEIDDVRDLLDAAMPATTLRKAS